MAARGYEFIFSWSTRNLTTRGHLISSISEIPSNTHTVHKFNISSTVQWYRIINSLVMN